MASAWGEAWGVAWGDSWGAIRTGTEGGGKSWLRWDERFGKPDKRVREELEDVIEQAAVAELPKAKVERKVRTVLQSHDIKAAYRSAYVEVLLEQYAQRLKEQEEEDEAIAVLLLH